MKGKMALGALGLTYLLSANSCAYISVAFDKHVRNLSAEEAAVHSLLNNTPIVNSIGYSLAHERFYGNPDYELVALNPSIEDIE